MFYLLLRLLHDEMETGKISREEYRSAIERVAQLHGIKRNGIR